MFLKSALKTLIIAMTKLKGYFESTLKFLLVSLNKYRKITIALIYSSVFVAICRPRKHHDATLNNSRPFSNPLALIKENNKFSLLLRQFNLSVICNWCKNHSNYLRSSLRDRHIRMAR